MHRRKTAEKHNKYSDISDGIIRNGLLLGWSPEVISLRMKHECSSKHCLSHSTIYRRIYDDRQFGGSLHTKLWRHGKARWKGGRRNRLASAKLIPDRVDISERPEIVDKRSRLGDWEGDTVHGRNAHLVTLVERTSRLTLVQRVENKCKDTVASAMINLFRKVPSPLTVTLDNGGEFAAHKDVHEEVGVDVYFAKPYASWQRGTNENTNGRLRRRWPKKTDFAKLSEKEIQIEVLCLNLTPRKVLGGKTPLEVFYRKDVALIT